MRPWLALVLALLAGCTEEAKKPQSSAPKAPEPIPSDFVVNSFFGSGTTEIKVKSDAGAVALPVEAGAATQQAAATPDAPATSTPASSAIKLLEPGEEPRAARTYELKVGRTESVAITIRSTISQEVSGQPAGSGAQPGMVFSLALTPQARAPSGETDIKVTFTKAEVLPTKEADPMQSKQLEQAFRALSGQAASFRLGPHGAISNFALANEKLQRSELGAIAQQTLEGLFVVLPDEPIGKGAKWEEVSTTRQEGIAATLTSTHTLKEVAADGLTIAISSKRTAAPQQLADPRAPKGTTVAVDGTANAQVKARLDRLPQKGNVESSTAIIINQPSPPGQQPKRVVQKVSTKQTLDNSTP